MRRRHIKPYFGMNVVNDNFGLSIINELFDDVYSGSSTDDSLKWEKVNDWEDWIKDQHKGITYTYYSYTGSLFEKDAMIKDEDKEIIIYQFAPEIDKKNIEIKIQSNEQIVVTLKYNKDNIVAQKEIKRHYYIKNYNLDLENISAKLENGLLEIKIQKKDITKYIEIK